MSNYGYFALLYDALTENVEYKRRTDFMYTLMKDRGVNEGLLIDLACGTASFSEEFIKLGFRVVGVDNSQDMLSVAYNKLSKYENSFSLISADISEYQSEAKADCVICCLDSINHLLSQSKVMRTFANVKSYLNDNGVFIFDVNTVYKHRNVLADNTFVFDNEDSYLVWDNELIDDRTVRIIIDIFAFNGSAYDRYSEEFNEIAYSIDEITKMLNEVGFNNVEVYDDAEFNAPKPDSERLYFVCSK